MKHKRKSLVGCTASRGIPSIAGFLWCSINCWIWTFLMEIVQQKWFMNRGTSIGWHNPPPLLLSALWKVYDMREKVENNILMCLHNVLLRFSMHCKTVRESDCCCESTSCTLNSNVTYQMQRSNRKIITGAERVGSEPDPLSHPHRRMRVIVIRSLFLCLILINTQCSKLTKTDKCNIYNCS